MKENNSNKINKFLLVTTVLSMIILLIGGTLSYFTLSTMSKIDALAVKSGKVVLGLGVSPLYTGHELIPLKDEYITRAYNQRCKDDLGSGACLAYGLEVFNYEEKTEVEGTIDFNLGTIENLSYMVLDEDGNTYVDTTHIDKDKPSGLTLGNKFSLAKATDGIYPSKKFILLIWLTDNNKEQDETDAGEVFTADVTYRTSEDGRLTASVDGKKSASDSNSSIGV